MFDKLSVVALAKNRMDWVAKRQEVLAENIANANTPKFVPSDLKSFDFKSVLNDSNPTVQVKVTSPMHVQPVMTDPQTVIKDRKDFESSADGNAVILEEQMAKVGEAKSAYDTAASLFQKQFKMLRTALGKGI
ncbi:flagellar basal body rod protein FlgB [Magnetospirillum aberrantis]|uniref:Flagellar basal body rod protein FlgB n=1 Tax=Magnetospirillum aberrantis SpK TaxID=908842 RepID=A0A7C9QVE9_9PROT|nr:flagellar basal body rod protein FlgB [Magnetospirillum aberrantis]NFV81377.1 flagellar basal body rod protein FlgB [Magnetospirillum aberrantis SpK]